MDAAAPDTVRPRLPCSKPAPAFTPTAVTAPALVTLKLVALIRLVKVPLKLRPLVAVLLALATVMPAAAPGWLTARAVAGVPLVPLTVRPTTLLAVGVIVFSAVLVGTCLIYEPLAGASCTVPEAAGNVIVLAPDGAVKLSVVVLPPVPTTILELLPPTSAKVPVPLPMLVAAVPVALMLVVPVTVRPPVPCIKPVPLFRPIAVIAPVPPFRVILRVVSTPLGIKPIWPSAPVEPTIIPVLPPTRRPEVPV